MQGFDPEGARKLLAEAGFPGGKGFPKYDLFLRAPSPGIKATAEELRAMLKKNLGIEVGIQSLDRKVFMDRLKKHELPLVLLGWAFDYYDASNFLGVYRTGGRHPWSNAEFDKLVDEANAGRDDAARCALYQKAEELLVKEAGAVFLWHPVVTQLKKPWVKGDIFKPNKFGVASWPQMLHGGLVPAVYIGKEKPAQP
jgi:ABC-type transport system substrate-binding protein